MKVCQLDGILFDKKKVVAGNNNNGAIQVILNNVVVEIDIRDFLYILVGWQDILKDSVTLSVHFRFLAHL